MPDDQPYSRPPIIEAVVDLTVTPPLTNKELEQVRIQFKEEYRAIEELRSFKVTVGPKSVASEPALAGYKMNAANGCDVMLLQKNKIVTSRLAPYPGWDRFFSKAKNNFDGFVKRVGRREVIRIGIKTVNRIDIPMRQIEGQRISEFLRLSVFVPDAFARRVKNHALSIVFSHPDHPVDIIVNSSTLNQVLIGHASFSLDIDVVMASGIPLHYDQMWDAIASLRSVKDEVFEQCITDRVRELIR